MPLSYQSVPPGASPSLLQSPEGSPLPQGRHPTLHRPALTVSTPSEGPIYHNHPHPPPACYRAPQSQVGPR
ncbi:hypothetical protein BD414DRAFT_500750 [Trametes punicea]|nr:hypothetical protein BD414DRAFT_500750 [Trametes punicea]